MSDEKGDRYYGSDLNKFIDKNCTHEMTSINIDGFQYRASKKRMRIYESKHIGESLGDGQEKALRLLAKILKDANTNCVGCQVCIIWANEPYDKLVVDNLTLGSKYTIEGRDAVIKWLELDDI